MQQAGQAVMLMQQLGQGMHGQKQYGDSKMHVNTDHFQIIMKPVVFNHELTSLLCLCNRKGGKWHDQVQ